MLDQVSRVQVHEGMSARAGSPQSWHGPRQHLCTGNSSEEPSWRSTQRGVAFYEQVPAGGCAAARSSGLWLAETQLLRKAVRPGPKSGYSSLCKDSRAEGASGQV